MRLPSKNRLSVVAIVFVTLMGKRALAEAPHLETPQDAADCPSAIELRNMIAGQLGRDDFDRAAAPSVSVRVRRSFDGTLAADVSVTTSTTTTRTIDGADTCADLVRAAALSVALAIENDAPKPTTSKPTPPKPAVGEPLPSPVHEAGPASEPPIRRDRVAITGSALTAVGLLPRPAVGAGIAGRVRVGETIWLSARGLALPGASMPNESFALSLYSAAAGTCVEPVSTTTVAAVGCAHVALGAFNVTKNSVDMRSDKSEAYVAATLSVGARARVWGPLHVEGAADAHLPFTRPTYLSTTCPPTGFEPPFVALALWLGAGISLR